MKDKKLLVLDFDGVLHSYGSGWKGARCIPDDPVDGAMAFLVEAVKRFDVAIHSSRSRYFGGRKAMRRWLRIHLTEHFWGPGEEISNCYTASDSDEYYSLKADGLIEKIAFPLWKPPAHVMIDDRAITFSGAWPSLDALAAFKPWNRIEPAGEV